MDGWIARCAKNLSQEVEDQEASKRSNNKKEEESDERAREAGGRRSDGVMRWLVVARGHSSISS
jgi:hypothetical protein